MSTRGKSDEMPHNGVFHWGINKNDIHFFLELSKYDLSIYTMDPPKFNI